MKIKFQTKVKGNYKEVMERFDLDLFEALKPKFGKMEVKEFTGSKKGDRVHIQFISPVKTEWISLITEDGLNEQEAYFIDEGHQLPWPLSYWKHKHIVRKIDEDSCLIVDDITFEAGSGLLSFLLYPAIWLGFAPRAAIYKAYFGS
ncbi:MAG: ligand-binding SRPBCC domain-containing protein [Polaribacter sp.]|jgi:ligand-binding SRPBCC domain-containing protein